MTVVYGVWKMMKLMMLLENNANHDVEGRRVHQGGRGHQGHRGIC